jgi:hypothetical protein
MAWPGAGIGIAREPLLRGHPLLDHGVLDGDAFGRLLLHGTVEGRAYPLGFGPVSLGMAAFVDWAKVWRPDPERGALPVRIDPGVGLRMHFVGTSGALRLDAARAMEDGVVTLSLAWNAD